MSRKCLHCNKTVPMSRISRQGGGMTRTCSEECSVLYQYDRRRRTEKERRVARRALLRELRQQKSIEEDQPQEETSDGPTQAT